MNAPHGERLTKSLEVYGSSEAEFESIKNGVGSEELSFKQSKRQFENLSDPNGWVVLKLMGAMGSKA